MARPRLNHVCTVEGCGKRASSRQLCLGHYSRWKRHGNAELGATSPGTLKAYLDNVVIPYEGDDCLIWPYAKTGSGYGHLKINGRQIGAHRLACAAVNGSPPTPKHLAAHSCGNGHLGCVNPRHLAWKTVKENSDDQLIHNTRPTKLTPEDVLTILQDTRNNAAIARDYGVSTPSIRSIKLREVWRHIEPPRIMFWPISGHSESGD